MSALTLLSPFAAETPARDVCNDATETFAKVITARGKYQNNGGWLFQQGFWSDHPDYFYVGNDEIRPNLEKKPIPSIAEDSSHSHRFPVFLRTLAEARTTEASKVGRAALNGLTTQFLSVVLKPADDRFPAPKVTNFMDGRNGVYRYGYEKDKPSTGYGPFQLSGVLPAGWWGFLPGDKVREIWRDFATRFPLTPEVVSTYTGPKTTAVRHPLVTWPSYFTNGFAEGNVRSIEAMRWL